MHRIKDAVLREFGDEGADTLERYFAQIEYVAFWCIRMLWKDEGILAVLPEVVQDVVIVRAAMYELHQVKTRDESQVPWTTAEVLPILCKQYYGRTAVNNTTGELPSLHRVAIILFQIIQPTQKQNYSQIPTERYIG